jgi:hypothetical protein
MSGGTLNHYDFRYRIDEDIDRIEDIIENAQNSLSDILENYAQVVVKSEYSHRYPP